MTSALPQTCWPPEVGNDHIWWQQCRLQPAAGAAALFIDRDGVVVEEVNYLHRIEDVRLIPGVAQTLALANANGWPVVMVTNQAGIGRGYYDWHGFASVNQFILRQLEQQGALVDAVLACPFHQDGIVPYRVAEHPMRKPQPGMLQLAARHLQLDLPASLLVGDQASDLQAARAAGLRRGFHVLTGHGAQRSAESLALAGSAFAVEVVPSIAAQTLRDALQAGFLGKER